MNPHPHLLWSGTGILFLDTKPFSPDLLQFRYFWMTIFIFPLPATPHSSKTLPYLQQPLNLLQVQLLVCINFFTISFFSGTAGVESQVG